MYIENKLVEMGIILPPTHAHMKTMNLPFKKVKVIGNRVLVSGHVGIQHDGAISDITGKVGAQITQEQAKEYAKLVGLSILSSLQLALGDLDKIKGWVKVTGFVNSDPNFFNHPFVINGFSEFILELFGEDIGSHTRSAVGVASLPFDCPVEIEAELFI